MLPKLFKRTADSEAGNGEERNDARAGVFVGAASLGGSDVGEDENARRRT